MQTNFKVGDIVSLKSRKDNGANNCVLDPALTVLSVEGDNITCIYYSSAKGEFIEHTFIKDVLVLIQ
jgi:hypothetical protein